MGAVFNAKKHSNIRGVEMLSPRAFVTSTRKSSRIGAFNADCDTGYDMKLHIKRVVRGMKFTGCAASRSSFKITLERRKPLVSAL